MNNAQELKAHLQDSNKARMYEEKKKQNKKCFVCKNKTKEYFTCSKTNRTLCEDCVEVTSSDDWGKLKTKDELSPIVVCQNCNGQNIGTNTYTYEGFCEDCKSVNVEIKMLSEVNDE